MSNPVPKVNISVVRGDTYSHVFTVAPDGTAQDLTGYTVRSQIRSGLDGTLVATPTAAITAATLGQITWSLSAAQTGAFTLDSMVYDVEVTSPSSVVTTVARGLVRMYKDATT